MPNFTFPQLSSGSIAQFPLAKWLTYHVVLNTTEDGQSFSYYDPTSGRVFWNLSFTNLTQTEASQLQELYDGCLGRWAPFLFLDPTDNLLSYSADLTNAVWSAPPGVTVTAQIADPLGGTGAFQLTNQSQAVAIFNQTIAAPPNYSYAFSAFVRANSSGMCSLVTGGNGDEAAEQVSLTTNWARVSTSPELATSGASVSFGFQLQPGQLIQVFGPQCEAQPEPSEYYRPTYGTGGVYTNAYFAMEAFTVSADAPGQFSTLISIEATR